MLNVYLERSKSPGSNPQFQIQGEKLYPYTTAASTLHLYPEEANMGESLDWTDVLDTPPVCTLTTILHYAFKTDHAQYIYSACKKAVFSN